MCTTFNTILITMYDKHRQYKQYDPCTNKHVQKRPIITIVTLHIVHECI